MKPKDGRYRVKLRITSERIPQLFPTPYSLTPDEFRKVMGSRANGDLRKIKEELLSLEDKVWDAINKLPSFSFELLRKSMNVEEKAVTDLFSAFNEKIQTLEKAGRVGTASSYLLAMKSLRAFHKRSQLSWTDITISFLEKYEAWMVAHGKSLTTVGIYLRNLRHLMNLALEQELIDRKQYPFGRNKYVIPKTRRRKIALCEEELRKIILYKPPEDSPEAFYKDMWVFTYLGNGINPKDLMLLKYRDIQGDYISIVRAKTAFTSRHDQMIVQIFLLDELKEIIAKWGTKPLSPEKYIFPFLKDKMTPAQIHAHKVQSIKLINTYMGRIGIKLGISSKITCQVARHSHATVLLNRNASISYIQSVLGHHSPQTTTHYLGDLNQQERRRLAETVTLKELKEEHGG